MFSISNTIGLLFWESVSVLPLIHRLNNLIMIPCLLLHTVPTLEEFWIVMLSLARTLSLSNFYSPPSKKPIAKPAGYTASEPPKHC